MSLKKRLLSAYNSEKRAPIQLGFAHEKTAIQEYWKLFEVNVLETGKFYKVITVYWVCLKLSLYLCNYKLLKNMLEHHLPLIFNKLNIDIHPCLYMFKTHYYLIVLKLNTALYCFQTHTISLIIWITIIQYFCRNLTLWVWGTWSLSRWLCWKKSKEYHWTSSSTRKEVNITVTCWGEMHIFRQINDNQRSLFKCEGFLSS